MQLIYSVAEVAADTGPVAAECLFNTAVRDMYDTGRIGRAYVEPAEQGFEPVPYSFHRKRMRSTGLFVNSVPRVVRMVGGL